MQPNAARSERPSTSFVVPAPDSRARILIVDDEVDACDAFRQVLQGEGHDAVAENSPLLALERLANDAFDLVLSDISMVEMHGLELCRRIAEIQPELPIVVVTGQGDMDMVVDALRLGACDFLTKPVDARALAASVSHALEHRARRSRSPRAAWSELDLTGLLGQSPAIRVVHELIRALSGSLASVLIQGETGTGKDRVARALHANSRARNGPFVTVDCGAIPAGLVESELFGHARGAFTDAKTARTGLLQQANGGTLLLDEIGELPLAVQPKLLRALQERKVRPVGGDDEVPFDCRLISATNRDLEREIAERRFREDLYYRINVITIPVPPLRARGNDISLLAEHFLRRFARARALTLSTATQEKLLAYAWPGNVRELENCLERMVALTRSNELPVDDLPEKIRLLDLKHTAAQIPLAAPAWPAGWRLDSPGENGEPTVVPLAELGRHHILNAMVALRGNKTRAAALLGIDRRTLHRRLALFDSAASATSSAPDERTEGDSSFGHSDSARELADWITHAPGLSS